MPSPVRFCPEPLRRPPDGRNDILITGTAAQIPAQVLANLCFGGRGILDEKRIDGQQETRCAKTALKAHRFQKSLLNRMECLAILRQSHQPLDGQDLSSICLHGEEQTRTDALAVEQDGTTAADSLLAAEMSSGKPKMVAQEVSQRQTRLHKSVTLFAVDGQLYRKLFSHE